MTSLRTYKTTNSPKKDKGLIWLTAIPKKSVIRLNLQLVLYLENLCLVKKSQIFNPKTLVVSGRC